jgi:hypothetical protein
VDVLGAKRAERLLKRIVFHYTPTHASWLNMAEIEIGILDKQCLNERIATEEKLVSEVAAWQKRRNQQRKTIDWSFTRHDADKKLGKYYVAQLTFHCTGGQLMVELRQYFMDIIPYRRFSTSNRLCNRLHRPVLAQINQSNHQPTQNLGILFTATACLPFVFGPLSLLHALNLLHFCNSLPEFP